MFQFTESLFNAENNDINYIMIAPKLAELLILKMRQGLAVYHPGE